MTKEAKILIAIIVIVVGGGLLAGFMGGSPAVTQNDALYSAESPRKGSGEISIVEFGDYQCPSCAQANPTIKKLLREYAGKVTLTYRHFPLPSHLNAVSAAMAAEAAREQGKFWEMHDKLYESQIEWSDMPDPTDTFVRYASNLDIDTEKFKQDIESGKYEESIIADQSDGYDLNVRGTPTFFINGKLQRSFSYDTLKNAIEAEL